MEHKAEFLHSERKKKESPCSINYIFFRPQPVEEKLHKSTSFEVAKQEKNYSKDGKARNVPEKKILDFYRKYYMEDERGANSVPKLRQGGILLWQKLGL
ncbi:MAG: hypothetical protein IMF10_04295 [Proteobacteria bacterium]|nr:hypothetical protein [Pseudomonadota bacterium]